MKKLNLFSILFVAVLAITSITSCNPTADDVKPSMVFSTDGAAIAASETVAINTPLLFKISAVENPSTKKKLKTLRIQSWKNNTPNVDSLVTIADDSFLGSFNFNADSTYSLEEKFIFTLTDKAGETATKTIIITTENAPVVTGDAITKYSATILGAQSNSTLGSFLDLHTGDVYLTASANANSADIDLIYYYGSSNEASFAAPTDVTVNGGAGNFSLATGLTTQNETIFAVNTTVDFAQMVSDNDDRDFPTAIAGSATLSNTMAVGDVIQFLTEDAKMGFIKVTNIVTGGAGEINIDVIIQQ